MTNTPIKLCGAKTRNGGTCQHEAGWATEHVGEGRCKLHGGISRAPIKTGRYAKSARGRLGKKIREHLNDPNPLDLTSELAILRARVDFIAELIDDQDTLPTADQSAAIIAVVGGIQKLVDTISKVQAREALTSNESLYLLVTLADVLQTEIAYVRKEAISDEDALRHILSKLRARVELPRLTGNQDLLGD